MKTKHTPAPWTFEIDDRRKFGGNLNLYISISTDYKPVGLNDGSRSIAAITGMARNEKEFQEANQANAALIAAAPELLAACEMSAQLIKVARQYFPASIRNSDKFDLENTCAAILKAISKAKGEQ